MKQLSECTHDKKNLTILTFAINSILTHCEI